MLKEINLLKIFFESPSREFNVREVARLLKIAPATASRRLKNLSRDKILKQRDERMLKLYKANMDNDGYRNLKVFYNIDKIKKSGLIEELNKFYLKPSIILFGSLSNGFDTEDSDIDIVIISEREKDFKDRGVFEKKLNRKLQLFVIKKINDLKNQHLINNVLNGTVLQGEVKWI